MRADFALDYDVLTLEQPHRLYLLARLKADPAPDAQKRRPLNLSLVLDRSGSMAGDKLSYTRQAAQFLIQHLSSNDYFSVVSYNEHVETLLEPQPVLHKDALAQRLEKLKASGMTNLSGGWLQGCTHVEQNLSDEYLNRVILMTDGLANRGIIQAGQLVLLAQQKRSEKIITTTMGLGADFNEDLLMEMADAGGGAFYFIESPEATPLIFQEELRDLLSVVGQNLTISLHTSDTITTVNQLNAYNMHTDGRRFSFSMGDIYGDEIKTLVLELNLSALRAPGAQEIAQLVFSYDEVQSGSVEHRVIEMPVTIQVATAEQQAPALNSEVIRSVLLLQAARARRDAVKAADKGDFGRASQILRQAAIQIDTAKIPGDLLQEEQSALLKQADDLERGDEYYDGFSRKMMATQANYTMTDRHERTQSLRYRDVERQVPPAVEKKPGVLPGSITWREQTIPLTADLIRVGRAPQNELVLDAKNISRFHCQIKREGERMVLEDLGSTNGTYVNEERITEPHLLSVGDVVRVGNEHLIFHDQR
jgi:uncharacterized protein YegL